MTSPFGVDPSHSGRAERGEGARRDDSGASSVQKGGVGAGATRPIAASPSGYRYEWALFEDWCIATEVEPLPASPITLVNFLAASPASDAVQLRRRPAEADSLVPRPDQPPTSRFWTYSARAYDSTANGARFRAVRTNGTPRRTLLGTGLGATLGGIDAGVVRS